MQAGVFHVVAPGNGTNGRNVAHVFNGGGNGNGHNIKDGFKVPGGEHKLGHGKPWGIVHRGKVYHAIKKGHSIACGNAAQNGNKPDKPAAKQ